VKQRLEELLRSIDPIDYSQEHKIQSHLDNLTKPKDSLGRLEELAKKYILIHGNLRPPLPKKTVLVFAGDHGVTEEGVSAFPKNVTFQMVHNFLSGGAGINVLARHVGAEVMVVDIGVDCDFPELAGLIRCKVAHGTRNMVREPALTREEAISAILKGAELAEKAISEGTTILATGEMGIGNTTPASALTAVFCDKAVRDVTGRGTGISNEALLHKTGIIEKALERHRPDHQDPIGTLAAVGGLEIAAICGVILGGASKKTPVVTDGFISTAGALVAHGLQPLVRDYLFASHQSVECGHRVQLEHLGLKPVLDLDLRLGEGTGAALAMGLIEAGLKIYLEMATFEGAHVSSGQAISNL